MLRLVVAVIDVPPCNLVLLFGRLLQLGLTPFLPQYRSQVARQKIDESFLRLVAEVDFVPNGQDPPSSDLSRDNRPTFALLVLAEKLLRFDLVANGGDFASRDR